MEVLWVAFKGILMGLGLIIGNQIVGLGQEGIKMTLKENEN